MKNAIKKFWNEEDGVGTVEILIILGILVTVAIVFRNNLGEWVNGLLDKADPTKTNNSTRVGG